MVIELSNGISRENITSPFLSVRVTHESLMATFAKIPLIEFTLRHSIFGFIKTPLVPSELVADFEAELEEDQALAEGLPLHPTETQDEEQQSAFNLFNNAEE